MPPVPAVTAGLVRLQTDTAEKFKQHRSSEGIQCLSSIKAESAGHAGAAFVCTAGQK